MKLNLYPFILLIIFTLFAQSCKSTKKSSTPKSTSLYKFKFEDDDNLSAVLDKAGASNKLVYVDMSASWCAPCQLMKRDVYTHVETAKYFNDNFITYLVDAEKGEGPDLKLIYGVSSYPTLLILDAKGREVMRREGGTFHEALIKFAKEGKAKYEGN